MKKICSISKKEFEIREEELNYYKKIGVPAPDISPVERSRLRMIFANQRNLFYRTCDATGKKVITYYPPDSAIKVYDINYWWAGEWDQLATGREYDFKRGFFEQFKELLFAAPKASMHRAYQFDENSDYTNYAGQNKNCYLIFDSDLCRDCLYSYSINNSQDLIDCFRVEKSELCCECVDCINCYSSIYLQNCDNCSDSWLLKNCIGCKHCFGCVNLKNREYCIFNEQFSAKDYQEKIKGFNLQSRKSLNDLIIKFEDFVSKQFYRSIEGIRNEDCIGSYLTNSKNSYECYDSRNLWDCAYVQQAFGDCKDCIDCSEIGMQAENCYESSYAGFPAYNLMFSSHSFPNANNLLYCYYTPSCSNLFACSGLHHKQFCILNKQYSESDYKDLKNKIIEHMKLSGEWGQHFPAELSPFEYNISAAQDFLPLNKEDALARGYRWREQDSKEYQASNAIIEDSIKLVKDEIVNTLQACKVTKKNYKIQRAELNLYRKLAYPLPEISFDLRHLRRLAKRNMREIRETICAISGKKILTAVPPEPGIKIVDAEIFAKECLS